jgi:beta-glucosidase
VIRSHHILGLIGFSLLSGCNGRVLEFTGTGGMGAIGGVTSVGATGGADSAGGATNGVATGGTSASVAPAGGFTAVEQTTAGAGGTSPSSECPALSMPMEATRPGATWQRSPEVNALLNDMAPDDKYKQMYGVPDPVDRGSVAYGNLMQSQDVQLWNGRTLRGLKFRDSGRGVNLDEMQPNNRARDASQYQSYSTAFPAESIRAASWDLELELRVGEALGDEVMGSLNNVLLAPCMNILRHPYWGRSQETYGEDAYHVGRMASALVAGVQQHVIACAKHYAANNVEKGRAQFNVTMNEQTLREVYTRHFDAVVNEGGVGCVMAAYNSVNGTKCTQNRHLLKDILKGPREQNGFGFRGFVTSDWWAMPGTDAHTTDDWLAGSQAAEAVKAGLDIEMPWALHYALLPNIVDEPAGVDMSQIDDAVGRILEQKFRFGIAYPSENDSPKSGPWGIGTSTTSLGGQYGDSLTNTQTHLDLAEESEIRSAVLLSNGTENAPVLPITSVSAQSIVVVGPDRALNVATSTNLQPGDDGVLRFATEINTGDRGTSRVNADPALSVGPYDGIKAAATTHGITSVTSGNSVSAASNADVVVVVVGLNAGDEGEEYAVRQQGDRTSLELPEGQADFVNSVLDLNKPTVIIIESGSVVNAPWLAHANQKQATIWAGYAGQRSGLAYGKLLFGDRNFSGKLPMSWPRQTDMDRLLQFRNTDTETVSIPYFHGYRLYDLHPEVNLVFPFGWGMSYTTFKYSNLYVPCARARASDVVYITADIENTGSVAGDEVMMLFAAGPPKPAGISGERPVKELKRFQRVNGIQPAGQPQSHFRVTFPIAIQDLRHWEGDSNGKWVLDSGDYTVFIGPNSKNLPLQGKLTVHE